jgi:hypothetical protein
MASPGVRSLDPSLAGVRALSWGEVRSIQERFAALNPYDPDAVPGSILKVEAINFDASNSQRPLYAFAISAKRYALFTLDDRGEPSIVEAKEHGLGHLRNPTDLDAEGQEWVREVWLALVREGLGHRLDWPAWADRPAVSRVSVSTVGLLETFASLNRGQSYADIVKPTNFALSVQVARLGYPLGVDPERFQLIAQFDKDPTHWLTQPWFDKYTGQAYRISVGRGAPPDSVQVKSYRDVLDDYRVHPEPKSLGADSKPCHRATTGLLTRRPVAIARVRYIGKESNALEAVQHGLIHALSEVRAGYDDPADSAWANALPFLKRIPVRQLAVAAGVSERMIKYLRAAERRPSGKTATAILRRNYPLIEGV